MNAWSRYRAVPLVGMVLLFVAALALSGPGAVRAQQAEQGQLPPIVPATDIAPQQDVGNRGTEFWLAFPRNNEGDFRPLSLFLFLTSDIATSGRVQITGILDQEFTVTPGEITTVEVPIAAALADGVENKGIHVTAQQNIIVYGLSQRQFSTDAYLGLPVPSLGTEYIVASYAPSSGEDASQYAVVATQDNTNVTVALPDGSIDTVALNRGQTFQAGLSDSDVTGAIITADRPVAVFGGNNCTNIPSDTSFCDHLVEQLPPTASWGQRFATVPLATRERGDTFRFLAAVDGTEVRVNGELTATLNRGQFHERLIAGVSFVEATQPILVAQYSNSTQFDDVVSDPFMMLIPPVEQFFTTYTVSTPASGFANNFINVVAPNDAVGNIILDGTAIPASDFTMIGDSGFSGAQVSVGLGTHNLSGPQPFGVFSYGFARDDSYGYAGGQNAALIAGVLVNPTSLNMLEGTSGTYEVVLSRQPTSDVTISNSFDTGQVSLDRSSLTFTPDNWDTPQRVTVTAVDDGAGEGAHATIISQDASSADASYDTVDVANVVVNIVEADDGEEVICTPPDDALDVVFLIDHTGSMDDVIGTVQREVNELAEELRSRVPETAFGLALIADYPIGGSFEYGFEGDQAYSQQLELTTDLPRFQQAVDDIELANGGDGAEAYARGIDEMVGYNWRDGAQRVVVFIGDAEPHTTNTSLGDGLADPGPDLTVGTADDVDFVEAVNRTRVNNITIVGLVATTRSNTTRTEAAFSFATDGKYERIPGDPESVLPTILGLVNTAVCDPVEPVAVTLDSFTATPNGAEVTVEWTTTAEVDTWGFHLYRSADSDRASATRITDELIPAQGRGQGGTTYTWADTATEEGVRYTYWLEETELDGTTIEYGPSVWLSDAQQTEQTIFIPLAR